MENTKKRRGDFIRYSLHVPRPWDCPLLSERATMTPRRYDMNHSSYLPLAEVCLFVKEEMRALYNHTSGHPSLLCYSTVIEKFLRLSVRQRTKCLINAFLYMYLRCLKQHGIRLCRTIRTLIVFLLWKIVQIYHFYMKVANILRKSL